MEEIECPSVEPSAYMLLLDRVDVARIGGCEDGWKCFEDGFLKNPV